VDKPWTWTVIISGDLTPYKDQTIAQVVVVSQREGYPSTSIYEGLKRFYVFESMFDAGYYREITGTARRDPSDQFWNRHPETGGMDPLTVDPESELDGSFEIEIQFWEVDYINHATREVKLGDRIAIAKYKPKLFCHTCQI
jgi:hypothetical protein